MISKNEAEELLRSIELQGAVLDENKTVDIVLGSRNNIGHILNLSSGLPRFHTSIINKFKFILQTPLILRALSPFEIRCCLCRSVISYPCWYYSIKYAVNHFHYFVCFDSQSSLKPNCKCFRRI